MVILIVDDSRLNLTIAQNILRENNIDSQILLANDGEEALDIIDKNQVDIILLDIVMPGISGVDVLKKVKQSDRFKNINIIMLTSLTDLNVLKQCFEYGANDFINKPIEAVEFIARIKAAIREVNYKLSLARTLKIVEVQNDKLLETNRKLKETQFYITQREKIVAIGELAAGVAHELNTPLGYVSSNFEVLQKDGSKIKKVIEKYRELIKFIEGEMPCEAEINKLVQVIRHEEKANYIDFIIDDLDDLLEESKNGIDKVSKIVSSLRNFASSGNEEDTKYNDINDIIEEVLLITHSECKNVAVIEKELSVLPLITCSRSGIGQVFVNLIINSVQAIKSQDRHELGKIKIKTYRDEKFIICEVFDDGPGVDRSIISRIFDPFFTTKDVGEGTGLGLSIAYDIVVSKNKGEILVNNNPVGVTFTIKLPA